MSVKQPYFWAGRRKVGKRGVGRGEGERRTSEETHGNSVMAVLGPCVRRLGEKKPILIRFKVFGDHTDIFQSPLK